MMVKRQPDGSEGAGWSNSKARGSSRHDDPGPFALGQGRAVMRYHAKCGPAVGGARYGTMPALIAVFRAPDDPMPIGAAMRIGTTTSGGALWELSVGGYDVP